MYTKPAIHFAKTVTCPICGDRIKVATDGAELPRCCLTWLWTLALTGRKVRSRMLCRDIAAWAAKVPDWRIGNAATPFNVEMAPWIRVDRSARRLALRKAFLAMQKQTVVVEELAIAA